MGWELARQSLSAEVVQGFFEARAHRRLHGQRGRESIKMLPQVVRGIDCLSVHGAHTIGGKHGVTEALTHLVALIVQQDTGLLAFEL